MSNNDHHHSSIQTFSRARPIPFQQSQLPTSPSTKRKREVLSHIPPTPLPSATTDRRVYEHENASDTDSETVEVPSPRTKIANKLSDLSLGMDSGLRKDVEFSTEFKKWRRRRRKNKQIDFTDWQTGGTEIQPREEIRVMVQEERLLARKKRVTTNEDGVSGVSVGVEANIVELGSWDMIPPRDVMTTTKKRTIAFAPTDDADSVTSDTLNTNQQQVILERSVEADAKQLHRGRLWSPPPITVDDTMDESTVDNRNDEDEEEDSNTEESGIGYRPTTSQLYARNQRRLQQIREYKARESREARAKRTERRRRLSASGLNGHSAKSSTSSLVLDNGTMEVKKVHFAS